jgi:hypothetical protein
MSGRPIRHGRRIALLAERKEVKLKAIASHIRDNLTLTSSPHWMIMGIGSVGFAIAVVPIVSTRNI